MTTPIKAFSKENAVGSPLLMRRLGLDALPAHETQHLPLDRLIVPEAPLVERSAKRLVKSIAQVGILQMPSVMLCTGTSIHDPEATFEVIAGRRRVLAARLAGLEVIKCEVYEASTPQLASLITLIENEQRSAAWIKEVEALRRLIDEEVGMTLDDLAMLGFDRASLSERLKIAQLPHSLVERVLAGNLNHETARKLIRLTRVQQEQIAALAEQGEAITGEVVKHALRKQIATGFLPLHEQLAQAWQGAPSAPALLSTPPPLMPISSPQNSAAHPDAASALATLIADLHCFEQSDDYRSVPQAVRSLTTALIQQAEVCLRTAHA